MTIIGTEKYLAVLASELDHVLAGQASSPVTRTLNLSRDCVYELWARQTLLPAVLHERLALGLTLAHELVDFLLQAEHERHPQIELFVAAVRHFALPAEEISDFDELSTSYNTLQDLLYGGMVILGTIRSLSSPGHNDRISDLMRRVSAWEYGYYRARSEALTSLRGESEHRKAAPSQALNEEKIEAALRASGRMKAPRVHSLRGLSGGMSKQTFVVTVVDDAGESREMIIRQDVAESVVEGTNTVLQNEFSLLCALNRLPLPVPEAYLLCTDPELTDLPYMMMSKMPGVTPGSFFGTTIEITESLVQDLASNLAQIHAIPLEHFKDYIATNDQPAVLTDTMSSCYRRGIAQVRRRVAEVGLGTSLTMTYLLDWLDRHVPIDERRLVLTHGDGNFHNVLVEGQKISAILDWELAEFGAPEQDLGYLRRSLEGIVSWDRFLGFYHAAGGREIREHDVPFYLAYQALRLFFASCNGAAKLARLDAVDPRFLEIDLSYLPATMGMIQDCTRLA